jgi:hypothetical protein
LSVGRKPQGVNVKRFVGLNAAGTSWFLGIVSVALLVHASWHLMVAVLGGWMLLGAVQLVLGGQSTAKRFETGRRGMWMLFVLTACFGTALVLLGVGKWLAALVVAAPVLAAVLCGAIIAAAFGFAFALLKSGWL